MVLKEKQITKPNYKIKLNETAFKLNSFIKIEFKLFLQKKFVNGTIFKKLKMN